MNKINQDLLDRIFAWDKKVSAHPKHDTNCAPSAIRMLNEILHIYLALRDHLGEELFQEIYIVHLEIVKTQFENHSVLETTHDETASNLKH